MALSPDPGPRGVRAHAGGAHLDAQRAVAAALDRRRSSARRGWRSRRPSRSGRLRGEPAEPVQVGGDLFVVVPDPGHVDRRARSARRRASAAPRRRAFMSTVPRPQRYSSPSIVSNRVGRLSFTGTVSMWPAMTTRCVAAEIGAGDDRVAVADHLEVIVTRERGLDGIRDRPSRCPRPIRCRTAAG